jgi:PERQ amino acid-rich with GYF domain-containing protein
MRRTKVDTDWISVGELTHRAAGPKIFLSPLMTPVLPGPPGLTRRLGNLNEQSPFGVPHQPVPIRSLHTSTLDSYINGNSQSASPSSSAGPVNHIFGNPEPSINTIGGNGLPYIDTPADGLGRSPYSNTTATYGFNGEFLPLISEVLFNHSLRDPHRENVLGHHLQSSVTNQLPYARSSPDRYNSGPGSYQPELSFSTSTALVQSPFSPVTPPVQHHTNVVQPTSPVPHLSPHNYTPSASPWGTPDLSLKRVGVLDPTYQSPRHSSAVTQPQQPSPWEHSVRTPWSTVPSEHSPDGCSTGDGTSSLTVSNLEQHNQQQLHPEPTLPVLPEAVSIATELNLHAPEAPQQDVPAAQPPTDISPAMRDETLEPPVTKPREKPVPPSKGAVSQPQPQQHPSETQVTLVSVHSPMVKTVWSKGDDGKKPSAVSLGFREIQEAEAKQSEARKVALERERAVATTRNVSTPTEDPPVPTTTSWGLATSQVQAGRKEPTSAGSPVPAFPVWTNVVKPPATKTMKEIQEEERRKKVEQQQVQEKDAINAAVRRSHAEAVSKVTTSALDDLVPSLMDSKLPAVIPSPAWTTVGANGKSFATSASHLGRFTTDVPIQAKVLPYYTLSCPSNHLFSYQ